MAITVVKMHGNDTRYRKASALIPLKAVVQVRDALKAIVTFLNLSIACDYAFNNCTQIHVENNILTCSIFWETPKKQQKILVLLSYA